jgi:23S rRNA A1618 N6-methylase RlmF
VKTLLLFPIAAVVKQQQGAKQNFWIPAIMSRKKEDPKKRNTHDKVFATELKKIKKAWFSNYCLLLCGKQVEEDDEDRRSAD